MTDSVPTSLDGITQQWVRSARRGDPNGFANLYEHIAPAVFTWASLRIRPEQSAILDPGDLVQEVWLRAWRKIDEFDAERIPFRFWIFRIAKNVLLEVSRQARRPDRMRPSAGPDDGGADVLAQVADSITGVSRRISRDEGLARFRTVVQELPEDDRKLVVHCGLEGLALREVGQRLGISEDATAKRWQRLRTKLRESDLPQYLLAE